MLRTDLEGIVSKKAAERFVANIHGHIRSFTDFKEGVDFRDFCTVWRDPKAFADSINAMDLLIRNNIDLSQIVGIEARGWVYAAPLALRRQAGLAVIRKHGKLPGKTYSLNYGKEYSADDVVEIQQDAITSGESVVIVDDLIATGGSTLAACELVEDLGGKVEQVVALVSLDGVGGLEKIEKRGYDVRAVIHYPNS